MFPTLEFVDEIIIKSYKYEIKINNYKNLKQNILKLWNILCVYLHVMWLFNKHRLNSK